MEEEELGQYLDIDDNDVSEGLYIFLFTLFQNGCLVAVGSGRVYWAGGYEEGAHGLRRTSRTLVESYL